MSQLFLDGFDAEAYWAGREHKKWVITLERGSGKKSVRDRILVSARTEDRAIATARKHSLLTGRVYATARLAHPWDLGCK
jgi:hypothetical protein